MLPSTILEKLKVKYRIINEQKFSSLGLVSYNCENDKVLTFVEKPSLIPFITDNVSMVLTTKDLADDLNLDVGIIIVDHPRTIFFKMHNYLSQNDGYKIKQYTSKTGENCLISSNAIISEYNVSIGNNVIIEDNVIVRENVSIGDNTVIRAGSIIGSEGFEFKIDQGKLLPVVHSGSVRIGDRVQIQYNTCIDKAIYPWDSTIIGNNVAIDNLVHIGHAVKIGDGTLVVANSGIGGRTLIGRNAWIGFGCTIRNGIKIGDNARINMGSVVTKNVDNGKAVSGNFAIEHSRFIEKMKRDI